QRDHCGGAFAAVRAGHPGKDVVAVSGAAGGVGGLTAQLARRAGIPPSPVIPGVWAAAVRSRTAAVQAGNCYFFFLPLLLFFLPFLPFLATPLTPIPDSDGQRNVDQARQRIIDRRRLSTTLTWWPPRVLSSGSPRRSAPSTAPTGR